ncbi:family 10 glycosylhydrolase [Mucilaginibacter robiniae]|uniref:Family 10 glycosylhydrolase n=1 Tax=Mucilaginibacter robiniae TaxID=2728022 RepID=A0A7L5DX51_9SPHI|nr:family 10 glycosylhydrolase [Mucilaginibacter robiniae]QJD95331.1 family 10 glycosylhydrolase [Mucilaginibacter robiniae]
MLFKRLVLILSIGLAVLQLHAQTDTIKQIHPAPKREFRGVWVATVTNVDWPSRPGLPAERQQQELTNILNYHQQTGINAIMLQVRPAADAFYAKSREPWSKWLSGHQGQAPSIAYDPLEFAITEAHKRGMELHAWFNPYRATMDGNFAALSPQHVTKLHPDWFFIYGGRKLFNPGLPEVRAYIVQVILDVVDNYDVDGIHMDDYFYPYPIAGQHINDAATYAQYGSGFDNIKDWRRNNVDLLIHSLADSIHKHKPYIKFGISPFGIWRNKSDDSEGSDTHGGSSYDEQFADSQKWIAEGWLDYINPQIYWPFGNRAAAFEKLVSWWSDNAFNHHLYVGQAAYRGNEIASTGFKNPDQLTAQIRYLRNNPRVQGSVFFSSASLRRNILGFNDSLRTHYYKTPALPPVMLWLDSVAPNAPRQLLVSRNEERGLTLNWQIPLLAHDKEAVYGYVVYRFYEGEKIDLSGASHILHIQYNTATTAEDETAEKGKNYTYIVTALDRLKNESPPVTTTIAYR